VNVCPLLTFHLFEPLARTTHFLEDVLLARLLFQTTNSKGATGGYEEAEEVEAEVEDRGGICWSRARRVL